MFNIRGMLKYCIYTRDGSEPGGGGVLEADVKSITAITFPFAVGLSPKGVVSVRSMHDTSATGKKASVNYATEA